MNVITIIRRVDSMTTFFKTISVLLNKKTNFKNFPSYSIPVLCVVAGTAASCTLWMLRQRKIRSTESYKNIHQALTPKLTARERRFMKFASVDYNGQVYMTPRDFLESIVQSHPRPRLKRKTLTGENLLDITVNTPRINKPYKTLFHELGDDGIISYSEYLFMLSVLMRPKSALQIAFDMVDKDLDGRIDKEEFLVIEDVFCSVWERRIAGKEDSEGLKKKNEIDTTLQLYFFGPQGDQTIRLKQFKEFTSNLQTEALLVEFSELSKGLPTISEIDFAESLIRYSHLDSSTGEILTKLQNLRKTAGQGKLGITFEDFEKFHLFLNHLEDFSMVVRLFARSRLSFTENEFQRAVKICTGNAFSPHMVRVIYAIFDRGGNGELSYHEFITAMEDRLRRGVRSSKGTMWGTFRKCLKYEMHHGL